MGADIEGYRKYIRKRYLFGFFISIIAVASFFTSLFLGSYSLSPMKVISGLLGHGDHNVMVVVWNIRLPRVLAAIAVGFSLAVAGATMQCVLRNPLASPFTLGISQGAAFGAAFAIIVLGAGQFYSQGGAVTIKLPYMVPIFAFLGALIATFVVLLLAKLRNLSAGSMILAGIAMTSVFSAATMLLQYFAEDVKVAAVVFWTFGDLGRVVLSEVQLIAFVAFPVISYFVYRRWDYNALVAGDEVATSLGLSPRRVRLETMVLASLLTALCVSFIGVIGFISLAAPHIVRLILGADHRFLVPLSGAVGSVLLLSADTIGRTIISPSILPVGIVTAFLGAPLFIYLLSRRSAE
jgi:iron complex transport system permease protein